MQTKLYEELRDLAMEEATVYAYLKTQEANGASDLHTAIMLIRQLAKEKKIYFDQVVALTETSVKPKIVAYSEASDWPIYSWWRNPIKWYKWRKILKSMSKKSKAVFYSTPQQPNPFWKKSDLE